MTRVFVELSMSLDGYVTGPDVSVEEPMGRGGEQLHDWMFEGRSEEELGKFQRNHFGGVGAIVLGRRMADLGIVHWGDEPAFHAPVFVVTHRPAETIVKAGGTSYAFVTSGTDDALRQAREAAGSTDVLISGGPDTARQYLRAGAVDQLHLHLVPLILGAGGRLFDDEPWPGLSLRPRAVTSDPQVTHLTYDLEYASTR